MSLQDLPLELFQKVLFHLFQDNIQLCPYCRSEHSYMERRAFSDFINLRLVNHAFDRGVFKALELSEWLTTKSFGYKFQADSAEFVAKYLCAERFRRMQDVDNYAVLFNYVVDEIIRRDTQNFLATKQDQDTRRLEYLKTLCEWARKNHSRHGVFKDALISGAPLEPHVFVGSIYLGLDHISFPMLIENPANADIHSTIWGSALSAAAYMQNRKLIQALLERTSRTYDHRVTSQGLVGRLILFGEKEWEAEKINHY